MAKKYYCYPFRETEGDLEVKGNLKVDKNLTVEKVEIKENLNVKNIELTNQLSSPDNSIKIDIPNKRGIFKYLSVDEFTYSNKFHTHEGSADTFDVGNTEIFKQPTGLGLQETETKPNEFIGDQSNPPIPGFWLKKDNNKKILTFENIDKIYIPIERDITLRYLTGNSTYSGTTWDDKLSVDGNIMLTNIFNNNEQILDAFICFAYGFKRASGSGNVFCRVKASVNGNIYYGQERITTSTDLVRFVEKIQIPISNITNDTSCYICIQAKADSGSSVYVVLDRVYFAIIYI
jgi:hypothetical protein